MTENIEKSNLSNNLMKSNNSNDQDNVIPLDSSISPQGELSLGDIPPKQLTYVKKEKTSYSGKIIISLFITLIGIFFSSDWLGLIGSVFTFTFAVIQVIPSIQEWIRFF